MANSPEGSESRSVLPFKQQVQTSAPLDVSALRERITVVIPTMDEEPTIGELVQEVLKYVGHVLVVDGHSKDRTRESAAAHGAKVILDRNRGKGDAIRCALEQVTTEITVFMDADGSHDPQDILKLVAPIVRDEADHVSGSRLIGGSSELHGGFDEFFRLAGSSFITACVNWRFKVRLSDTENGYRAIKTEVARKLGLREDIATIEQEMIMKTLRMGFRISEVPTHEYRRKFGASHIRLSKVWFRFVYTLMKYLFF